MESVSSVNILRAICDKPVSQSGHMYELIFQSKLKTNFLNSLFAFYTYLIIEEEKTGLNLEYEIKVSLSLEIMCHVVDTSNPTDKTKPRKRFRHSWEEIGWGRAGQGRTQGR